MLQATPQMTRNQVTTPAADEIRITRVFNAPRALVYKAWTDPDMLVHWFGCAALTTATVEADVRVGGQWRVVMRSPEGEDYPVYGEYLELSPVDRIVMTHQWENNLVSVNPARHNTRVTIQLFEENGSTRLEFRQTGLASIASRDSHIGGWCDSMDALMEVLKS
jgi:uncharacterized protein YndB with AHSA1/START domain